MWTLRQHLSCRRKYHVRHIVFWMLRSLVQKPLLAHRGKFHLCLLISRIHPHVPTKTLTICFFTEIIARLSNFSISGGVFPSTLKCAAVTPLLKKPSLDPDNPSSCRPIPNLNTISKFLERLFLSRLHPQASITFNLQTTHFSQLKLLFFLNDEAIIFSFFKKLLEKHIYLIRCELCADCSKGALQMPVSNLFNSISCLEACLDTLRIWL